ncbi:MAG: hypothetical protein Q8P15_01925 [Nanoarchaeota archaeon]|nr:hypothetical protein [Nanoarchaeota archaeon]
MGNKVLYHFTLNPDKIKSQGFQGSRNIDKGIGAKGASLFGTYFFENLKDLEDYKPLIDAAEKKYGKRGEIIEASLDDDAKILDGNEAYMNEFKIFRKGKGSSYKPVTKEFQKAFTDYLREEGYDAVRLESPLLGNHNELVVLNENKLKLKKESGLEKKILTSIFGLVALSGIFLFSGVTGNTIGLSNSGNFFGIVLFLIGCGGIFFILRRDN